MLLFYMARIEQNADRDVDPGSNACYNYLATIFNHGLLNLHKKDYP